MTTLALSPKRTAKSKGHANVICVTVKYTDVRSGPVCTVMFHHAFTFHSDPTLNYRYKQQALLLYTSQNNLREEFHEFCLSVRLANKLYTAVGSQRDTMALPGLA